MEKNKKILLGGIIVTIITGAVLFCYLFGKSHWSMGEFSYTKLCSSPIGDCIEPVYNPLPSPKTPPVATSTPMSEWKTFVNTEYGYSVLVPHMADIVAAANHPDLEKSAELSFYGEGGYLNIKMNLSSPNAKVHITQKEAFERDERLLALDLKSYAEFIWKTQVDDKNSFVPNKEVGELKEVQLSGVKAYAFTLTGSFKIPLGGGGYVLDSKSPYVYIIAENLQGQKMVIHHTIGETSEKMVQSIKFIK